MRRKVLLFDAIIISNMLINVKDDVLKGTEEIVKKSYHRTSMLHCPHTGGVLISSESDSFVFKLNFSN